METYLRLLEANVVRVLGFNVPQLLGYDAELLVLEMTVVQQPFVLDFAEVRIQTTPSPNRRPRCLHARPVGARIATSPASLSVPRPPWSSCS